VWNLAYRQTAAEIEREFERNRELHGERIQCRRGCTDCCHQLFQITEIEAAMISAGVRELDQEVQQRIRARASGYMETRRVMVSQGEPEAWGQLPPPGSRLLCPLLEDGACLIYDHRPLLCRKFGIPLWNPDRPGRVYACELNFRDGDEISDPALIQIQTGIHEGWKQVQVRYNSAGGRRFGEAITVARAVLEDFSALASCGPRTAS
jgi:Fe-S-cluster containining protein